ncbi:MAG: Flp/Fap pilin component [Pseudomonadota bacterium]
MKPTLRKLLRDQNGATVIEYGLILAFIFLAIMFSVSAVADQTTAMWNYIAEMAGGALSGS